MISERLRSLMRQHGWTAETLAGRLGVPLEEVERWMAGEEPPQMAALAIRRLAFLSGKARRQAEYRDRVRQRAPAQDTRVLA